MDHQQIDPGQGELLEALVDRALEIARRQPGEPDLGGEKNLVALEARTADAGADLALIAVHLCGVEMAIAEMQGRLDQFDAKILFQRHGAEPEGGYPRAMQFQ